MMSFVSHPKKNLEKVRFDYVLNFQKEAFLYGCKDGNKDAELASYIKKIYRD